MPIFGRSQVIAETARRLCESKDRILILGQYGLGKTTIINAITAECRKHASMPVVVSISGADSGFGLPTCIAEMATQIINTVSITNPSFSQIRKVLNKNGPQNSARIMSAWLTDLAALTPLKETGVVLAAVISESTQEASARAKAETLSQNDKEEILPGFIKLLDQINKMGHHGILLIDAVENCTPNIVAAIMAILQQKLSSWAACVCCNSEGDAGIETFSRFAPQVRNRKLAQVNISGLDVHAIQAWFRFVHKRDAPDSNMLARVENACQGRAFWIREWIFDPTSQPENFIVEIAQHFQSRLGKLPDEATRTLVRRISLLPLGTCIDYPVAVKLFGESAEGAAATAIQALKDNLLIESPPNNPDSFRITHEITGRSIRAGMPKPLRREMAAGVLNAVSSVKIASNDIEDRYCKLVLAEQAEQFNFVSDEDISVGMNLLDEGAVPRSIAMFKWLLLASEKTHLLDLKKNSLLGLGRALYQGGFYRESLEITSDAEELDLDDQQFFGEIEFLRASISIRLSDYPRASIQLKSAISIFESINDVEGVLDSKRKINVILRDLEKYEEARMDATSLVLKAESLLDNNSKKYKLLYAACLRAEARSYAYTADDVPKATASGEKALSLAHELNSTAATASAHLALGEVFRHACMTKDAMSHYEQAINLARQAGDRDCVLWSCLGLSDTLFITNDIGRAADVLIEAEEIVKFSPNSHPLENAHWSFSNNVLQFKKGEIDLDDIANLPELYVSLNLEWPKQYIGMLERSTEILTPKSF